MKESIAIGDHKWIYEDLLTHIATVDIATSAERLNLHLNDAGEAEVSFLGDSYLVSNEGVRRFDGQKVSYVTGSALIHYILKASRSRPFSQFVTFAELAGPLFKQGSYSKSALERPIIKRFQGRIPELLSVAAAIGGHKGGDAGLGSISYHLYLKAKDIQKEGPLLDGVRKAIAEHAGENAAKMIVAGVAFEVTEARPLVAMG